MNIILFQNRTETCRLSSEDYRYRHIINILKMGVGSTFAVGVVNSVYGKATITAANKEGIQLSFDWSDEQPAPLPCILLVGLPRPQTARKILKEITSLGIREIHFFKAEKSEPSYIDSKLWKTEEWSRLVREGAEQAFSTYIPGIAHHDSLETSLEAMKAVDTNRVALDLYEYNTLISRLACHPGDWLVAIGPEGGWTNRERGILRKSEFQIVRMGEQVLRTETAVVAAISSLATTQGWWDV